MMLGSISSGCSAEQKVYSGAPSETSAMQVIEAVRLGVLKRPFCMKFDKTLS